MESDLLTSSLDHLSLSRPDFQDHGSYDNASTCPVLEAHDRGSNSPGDPIATTSKVLQQVHVLGCRRPVPYFILTRDSSISLALSSSWGLGF
ncbi:unnamed protein product, partial [Protopolystoma xenopodis]